MERIEIIKKIIIELIEDNFLIEGVEYEHKITHEHISFLIPPDQDHIFLADFCIKLKLILPIWAATYISWSDYIRLAILIK